MAVENILKIIDSLAEYIVYFYPGYMTIYIFYFLRAKTLKDENNVIAKAVVISFIYKLFVDKVPLDKLSQGRILLDSKISYHVLLILIAVVVPYIGYRMQKSEKIIIIFNLLKITTRFEDNEIDILDNQEISAWLKVYMQDEKIVYEGFLGDKELESGKRQFISLKKYRKYILGDDGRPKEPYIEEHDSDDDVVVIFYNQIKTIEKNKI